MQPPLAMELAKRNKLEHLLPFSTVEGAAKAYSYYDNLQEFLDLRDATLSVGCSGFILHIDPVSTVNPAWLLRMQAATITCRFCSTVAIGTPRATASCHLLDLQ